MAVDFMSFTGLACHAQIISCNIGNPQELGQLPITFFRQV